MSKRYNSKTIENWTGKSPKRKQLTKLKSTNEDKKVIKAYEKNSLAIVKISLKKKYFEKFHFKDKGDLTWNKNSQLQQNTTTNFKYIKLYLSFVEVVLFNTRRKLI